MIARARARLRRRDAVGGAPTAPAETPTTPATGAPGTPDPEAAGSGCTLRLEDVHVRLGERHVLRGVDLELRERRVGIVGANGSGKSTLARLLDGLVVPTSGRVLVDGLDTRRDGAAVRRRVGFVFTDPDAQIVMPTVAEDVAYSLRRHATAERDALVRAALARRGLADHADHPAHLLSGGQKQLLALTSVLAAGPRLVVADEPTTLLDLRNTRRFAAELAALPQQVVLVSHDLSLMDAMDRVLVVEGGRVVADDEPGPAVAHYLRLVDGAS
ncbi:biotin transport system ATP-binding protein [Cellulosimicrobium cellulans]|nr:biotin transport system ATP-binding protein [Cellulosimicrobium cellulans]